MSTLKISTSELRNALQRGLAIVHEQWSGKAKDWVTGVHVADIDDDGDDEVIAVSRDGRVRVFTKSGDERGEYPIGDKTWVGTVVGISASPDNSLSARIFVGTRDGKIYALDKNGKTVEPARQSDGNMTLSPLYASEEQTNNFASSAWLTCSHVIRQIHASSLDKHLLLVGSEDRHAYALDYTTGNILWSFPTKGWVRTVFLFDIDNDGAVEALIGSVDNFLYVLDMNGKEKGRYDTGSPIRSLIAADIDQDEQVEILVGTDCNALLALTPEPQRKSASEYDLKKKWQHHTFGNFFCSLQVADVDNDGKYEIIASSEDKYLYFLDRRGKFIWRSNIGARIFSISIQNGGSEIFVGAEDNKVHSLHINLNKALCKSIRKAYQSYSGSTSSLAKLPIAERSLLQDILSTHNATPSNLTLQSIDGEGRAALENLIDLYQQKVQILWFHPISEHIRSLCIGNISGDEQREVIIGTARGSIQAYSSKGRHLWSLSLATQDQDISNTCSQLLNQVSALQVGRIYKKNWVEILACTTDHHIYTVRGTTHNISKQTIKPRPEIVQDYNHVHIDEWISSLSMRTTASGNTEVLVGSEAKRIYIYDYALRNILQEIVTDQGVKIVHSALIKPGSGDPEVIAGSINNQVYAYCQQEDGIWTRKWCYSTRDRVRALCSKDINHDGHIEIIVGSEDRNVHVLNNEGHLLWRYYLPQSVYAIDVGDINNDSRDEIVVGCTDGYLYIFSPQGDLLWRYCCGDGIRAICIDTSTEHPHAIIIATEHQVALLQVVEQQKLEQRMNACWSQLLQKNSEAELFNEFLTHIDTHANLCIFALHKIAQQPALFRGDFAIFEELLKDTSVEIRRAVIHAVVALYPNNSTSIQPILASLLKDVDPEVRLTFINHIDKLMQYDWKLGFTYLEGLSRNADRFIRRAVVRQLHQLIERQDSSYSLLKKIFALLLLTVRDDDSEWICQESAVALSHLFNRLPHRFLYHIFSLIAHRVRPEILLHLGRNTQKIQVRRVIVAFASSPTHIEEFARVAQAVEALESMKGLLFGEDSWRIYHEMQHVLAFRAIHEIAYYHCLLPSEPFTRHNYHYINATHLFTRLNIITRPLRSFLGRNNLNDQLSSLVRAQEAIDMLCKEVEQGYAQSLAGLPMSPLPDHALFRLLLNQWKAIIEEQLHTISGHVELEVVLLTRDTLLEEKVTVCLNVCNKGYTKANYIEVELLHSNDFKVIGKNCLEIEDLLASTEVCLEFTIKPQPEIFRLHLEFEIFIDEAEVPILKQEDLVLNSPTIPFRHIPNPYHSGIPQYSESMFFGREHDIEFLRNTLTQPSVQSMVVLYGQKRSGKTMLLLRLLRSSDLEPHIPVYIDLQSIDYQNGDCDLFYKIALQIMKAMLKRNFVLPKPNFYEFKESSRNAFDAFLDLIETRLNERKVILMIDEFGCLARQVGQGKVDQGIFEYLRSLIQHRRNLNFLLADIYKITQFTASYRSVFFNMALHHKLSKLRSDAAEKLIEQPVKAFLVYEPHVVHKIRQLTGDQPYFIHLLCRTLIDLCNTKGKSSVALYDVNQACRELALNIGSHYENIWKQIFFLERIILSVIATVTRDDGRGLSQLEIEELLQNYHIPFQRTHLVSSLKSLIDDDIIEQVQEEGYEASGENTRYRIPIGLFRRWLYTENHPQRVIFEEAT